VNRTELVAALSERAGTTKSEADAVLSALGDVLIDSVKKGEKVQVPGLLTVERVDRAARTGRNPATGETLDIPSGYGVKATAGSKLKKAVK
jgi:DNA-binding protein HU-beta